jgi:hypothetical protein
MSHEKYGGVRKYAIGFWRYSKREPDLIAVDAQWQAGASPLAGCRHPG